MKRMRLEDTINVLCFFFLSSPQGTTIRGLDLGRLSLHFGWFFFFVAPAFKRANFSVDPSNHTNILLETLLCCLL